MTVNYKEIETDAQERLDELKAEASELVHDIDALHSRYSFDSTNVKLHEVSYALSEYSDKYTDLTEEQAERAFEYFCEDNFRYFEEDLSSLWLEREHIGRTSSFYIVPAGTSDNIGTDAFYEEIRGDEKTVEDVLADVNEAYIGMLEQNEEMVLMLHNGSIETVRDIYDYFYSTSVYDDYNDFLEEADDHMNDLDDFIYLFNENMSTLRDELENIQKAYDYIRSFKRNQLQIFDEWMEDSFLMHV